MTQDRFTFSETDIPAAIRALREALGRSEEVMAQIVGCSLPAYRKWEMGVLMPSGEWLIRLLQLCPNEETRNAFRIRAERRTGPRESSQACSPLAEPLSHADRFHYRAIARSAVEEIYESGEAGILAADARLRDFAENLQGAARYYSTLLKNKKDLLEVDRG
ncbi:MAG: helix-turn-helix domain-containing protein [Terriglobia bacterium]